MNKQEIKEFLNKLEGDIDKMETVEFNDICDNLGLVENPDVLGKSHFDRVINKAKVTEKLRNNTMLLSDYHYGVQHNSDCIKAALEGNIDNYDLIPEEVLNIIRRQKWVANAYYTGYLKREEEKYAMDESFDLGYYPVYLLIEDALVIDKERNRSEVIKEVIDTLTNEELDELKDIDIAKTFIDPNLDSHVANTINEYIMSGKSRTR